MSFYRIYLLIAFLFIIPTGIFADNHDIQEEEPLPLNDPFAGDDAAQSKVFTDDQTGEGETEIRSLSKYKLVGVFLNNRNQFATLVNDAGEFLTLELFEELTKGLQLVELNIKEAIFQQSENSFISINFKNQIRVKNE